MTTFPTLPTGPFEHVSMDYARLRDEGLGLLGRLAGAQWTDFNTHDPGITILEQLCYAITDLGYRIAYPMPELLAGGDAGLPGPEAIFPSDPVTPADLRKAALDTDIPEGGTMLGFGVKFFGEGSQFAGQNERSFPVVLQYIDDKSYVVWPKSQMQRETVLPLPKGTTFSNQ